MVHRGTLSHGPAGLEDGQLRELLRVRQAAVVRLRGSVVHVGGGLHLDVLVIEIFLAAGGEGREEEAGREHGREQSVAEVGARHCRVEDVVRAY